LFNVFWGDSRGHAFLRDGAPCGAW